MVINKNQITIRIAMKQSINPIFKLKKKISEEYTQYILYLYMDMYLHFLKTHKHFYIPICTHIPASTEREVF